MTKIGRVTNTSFSGAVGAYPAGKTPDIGLRGLRWFCEKARSSELRTLLLLLDNTQNLKKGNLEFIFDLRHQMQAEGLSLITVAGIYQPTLEQFFGDFEKNESWRKLSLDVFRRDMSFSCVSNQDDLRLTLECVDLAEDGRGQSWVQFFLPMAYAKGFRLANMTDALFGKLSAESKWLELGFPSGAVFAIIRKFLSLATHHDGGSCSLDGLANDILNSVFETSGFRAAMADKLSADVYNGHI